MRRIVRLACRMAEVCGLFVALAVFSCLIATALLLPATIVGVIAYCLIGKGTP